MRPPKRPLSEWESEQFAAPVKARESADKDRKKNVHETLVRNKLSVMLIPHSDHRVINIHVNVLLLSLIGGLAVLLVVGFFVLSAGYSGIQQKYAVSSIANESSTEDFNRVLAAVKDLMKGYQVFQDAMNKALKILNIAGTSSQDPVNRGGDLSTLNSVQELSSQEVREALDIRRLSNALELAGNSMDDISGKLKAQRKLLLDIPNLWPVSGGRSAIDLEFGQSRNPISDKSYVHKGIEIGGMPGLTVVAAANGKVVEAGFDTISGNGAYVILEHKYGFRTSYSHLGNFFVKAGEEVFQGQRIGTLGSSGASTKAALDFQIMLGTQVLNPASFLKVGASAGS